jgi:uncharacterized protein (UPF0332 family)
MTYEDCIKKGRLRRKRIEGNVVERTLKMAEEDLIAAKGSLDREEYAWSLVQSYSSMLNCARAILFYEGFIEKSHYCVVQYLRYHHPDEIENHIERLDIMRKERHQVLYDSRDSANRQKAIARVNWAREFSEGIRRDILLRKT